MSKKLFSGMLPMPLEVLVPALLVGFILSSRPGSGWIWAAAVWGALSVLYTAMAVLEFRAKAISGTQVLMRVVVLALITAGFVGAQGMIKRENSDGSASVPPTSQSPQ